ncbi:mannose-6-phosphate isomerase [Microthyrium microscopicum]|uniref:Mannose-6-phosphate isomerase n=1 Tax=Microthyrium microscopicum TaxID=703497 RepID=A0A6A6UEQ3_9PEZI|nr:mannose-6-phosphate isomerase [Microthyrium microscopicum]
MRVPLYRLQCGVNSYEWGKVGKDSAAAKYAQATPADGFSIAEDKPYAELWMGTHPSNPSKDVETGRTLLDLIQDNQSLLGPEIAQKYNDKLPFLFKVLSINKALSIQAHPNKKLAEQLHGKDPKNYPDDNHKPEMTIAITPFSGLCGFRPLSEIAGFIKNVSALKKLIGDEPSDKFTAAVAGKEEVESESEISSNKKALQETFTALLNSSKESIASATKELLEEAKKGAEFAGGIAEAEELSKLIPILNSQFPDDIGLFVLFFLNYVKLEPGEAMYLKADDIHAYISGDIIECMAASDNVIRAGFTPKFKDVSTLTSILTYDYASPEKQKLPPQPYPYATLNAAAYSSGSTCELYDPPIEEFAVVRTVLGKKGKATFDGIEGPSIIICTEGSGTIKVGPKSEEVKAGYVYFVGSTAAVSLENDSSSPEDFVSFKAYCELDPEAGKL